MRHWGIAASPSTAFNVTPACRRGKCYGGEYADNEAYPLQRYPGVSPGEIPLIQKGWVTSWCLQRYPGVSPGEMEINGLLGGVGLGLQRYPGVSPGEMPGPGRSPPRT